MMLRLFVFKVSKKVGIPLISTLAILLLCASLAESHGEGCQDNGWDIDHSQPMPDDAPNLCWWSLQHGGDQDGNCITENYHHRHYMTKTGETPKWRFWDVFEENWDSDTFSNCPQGQIYVPEQNSPPPTTENQSPPPANQGSTPQSAPPANQGSSPQSAPPANQGSSPQSSPPDNQNPSLSTQSRRNPDPPTTITEVVEQIIEEYVGEVEEDEPETESEPEPVPEPEMEYHEFQFYGSGKDGARHGVNFVAFPVAAQNLVFARDIQKPSDIWENYSFIRELGGSLLIYADRKWLTYGGNGMWRTTNKHGNQVLYPYSELALTQNMGVVITLKWDALVGMRGVPFTRAESVTLMPGGNFVGFPVAPTGVIYISDLLDLGVDAVLTTVEGNLHVIKRAGDPGDGLLLPNSALFLVVREPVQLTFTKEVSAAPAASQVKYLRWGQLKQGR